MLAPRFPRPWLGLVLLLVLGTSGCGTFVYNRAWDDFRDSEDGVGLVGRWKGTWRSDRDGHAGKLRCMLAREGGQAFLARFHSTYGWLLFFRHSCTFEVVGEENGVLRFEGEEDLGKMVGGVYRYRGTVEGDHFEATYEADNGDHGTFEMQRLEPRPPEAQAPGT